jgi:hypothetical protein
MCSDKAAIGAVAAKANFVRSADLDLRSQYRFSVLARRTAGESPILWLYWKRAFGQQADQLVVEYRTVGKVAIWSRSPLQHQ